MKRTLLTALTVPALVIGLAACSGQETSDASSAASSAGNAASKAASDGVGKASEGASSASDGASQAAPVPATSRTMGAAPANEADADVKMTKCEAGSDGVAMTATVKNTTDKKRMYILTGLAYDEKKKMVASAALMSQEAVDPGESVTVEGKSSPTKAKGKLTCEVSEINSMPQG